MGAKARGSKVNIVVIAAQTSGSNILTKILPLIFVLCSEAFLWQYHRMAFTRYIKSYMFSLFWFYLPSIWILFLQERMGERSWRTGAWRGQCGVEAGALLHQCQRRHSALWSGQAVPTSRSVPRVQSVTSNQTLTLCESMPRYHTVSPIRHSLCVDSAQIYCNTNQTQSLFGQGPDIVL